MAKPREPVKNSGQRSKKVLLITYYWPPAGGPGVQRMLKFARYLPKYGWEPIVLTVSNGEYPALDSGLAKDIPQDCQVYSSRTIEFFSLFKKLSGRKRTDRIETYILNSKPVSLKDRVFRWIRVNLFIPDARLGWYPFAVEACKRIIREEKPDLIFSSSPPHSLQVVARKLAIWSQLPWVADFRDPWTDAFWDKDIKRKWWADRLNKRLEQKVLEQATLVTTVSHGFQRLFNEKGRSSPIAVITNGFDAADFSKGQKTTSSKMHLVYAGHIAASQNPVNLFQALAALPAALRQQIQVDFYGSQDNSVKQTIDRFGLSDLFVFHGYVNHNRVIQAMQNADVLCLLLPQRHAEGIIPGKLFEYLATGNYILGIGDTKGETARILADCEAGEMFDFDASIQSRLESLVINWNNQEGTVRRSTNKMDQYLRETLTQELARLFDTLCD